jgi:hypothetical protein
MIERYDAHGRYLCFVSSNDDPSPQRQELLQKLQEAAASRGLDLTPFGPEALPDSALAALTAIIVGLPSEAPAGQDDTAAATVGAFSERRRHLLASSTLGRMALAKKTSPAAPAARKLSERAEQLLKASALGRSILRARK